MTRRFVRPDSPLPSAIQPDRRRASVRAGGARRLRRVVVAACLWAGLVGMPVGAVAQHAKVLPLAGDAAGKTRSAAIDVDTKGYAVPGPPLQVIHVETDTHYGVTDTQGTVLVAETTAPTDADPAGWWLRLDVRVRNAGAAALELTAVGLSTDQSDLVLEPLASPPTIAADEEFVFKPVTLDGAGPVPSEVTIHLHVSGYATSAQSTYLLETFEADTATGGYRFPGRGDLLPPGVFWKTGGHHAHWASQRYAYDLGAARWDETLEDWTGYSEQAFVDQANGIALGSSNDHFLVFGLPVYAMADGVIEKCRRGYPDNPPGGDSSLPSNVVSIDHGNGEHSAYAHLQQDSIPAHLCPVETPGAGVHEDHVPVPVHEGDFLGLVGNSGTGYTHLHVHLVDGAPDTTSSGVRSLPLPFDNLFVHDYEDFDPTTETADWNWVTASESAAIGTHQLIYPNSCGWGEQPIAAYAAPGVIGARVEPDCDQTPQAVADPSGVIAIPGASERITLQR